MAHQERLIGKTRSRSFRPLEIVTMLQLAISEDIISRLERIMRESSSRVYRKPPIQEPVATEHLLIAHFRIDPDEEDGWGRLHAVTVAGIVG